MISIVRRTLIKLGGTVSATPPYKSEGFSSKSIMDYRNHLSNNIIRNVKGEFGS